MLTNPPQIVSETAQNVFEQFLTENVTGIKVLPKQDNKVSPNYYIRPYEIAVRASSNTNVNKLTSGCFRNCTKCFKLNNF